jgi:ABC-type Fe3+-siderophore transport system permease subunit
MKKLLLILGILIFSAYARPFFLFWIAALMGSLISETIYLNAQTMLSQLKSEGYLGLVIAQTTLTPLLSALIAIFLYKKYKKLN